MVISEAQKKLKRTVKIDGDVELGVGWNLSPSVAMNKISIGNSTWAAKPNFLTIDELEVHFSLLNILRKQLDITYVTLKKPVLNLESSDKHHNWDFLEDVMDSPSSIVLTIDKVKIRDGILVYNYDTFNFDKFDLTAHGDFNHLHVQLQGHHDKFPIKANFDVKSTGKEFNLEIASLQSGNSDLSGEILITLDPVNVKGEFKAGKLRFTDFSVGAPNPSGEYSIPDTPFPVDKLKGSVFDVTIKVNDLILGGIDFKKVNLNIQNEKDVLKVILKPPAGVADGKFSFEMTYDLNKEVPVLNLQAKTTTIQLSTVLEQMFDKSPVTGSTLDFKTNLQGQGTNLKAIVGSLNGQILAVAGPGNFLNSSASLGNIFSNVLSAVITFDKQQPSTAFKCGVMNFRVNNGIATANSGIGIEAASVNVLGTGSVNLSNGTISFSMVPQNITTNPIDIAHFSVAQLVAVKGTISKPEMTLNSSNLMKQGASAIITAGLASSTIATGGLGAVIAGSALMQPSKNQNVSPCKTALAQ